MLNTPKILNTTTPPNLTARANLICCGRTVYADGMLITGTLGEILTGAHSTATPLSVARSYLAATTFNGNAMFAGGNSSSSTSSPSYVKTIDVYNSSLIKSLAPDLTNFKANLAATSTNAYAFFGGGTGGTSAAATNVLSTVDAYDSSLTKTSPSNLRSNSCYLAASSIGNYALFGGGGTATYSGSYLDHVVSYDSTLTRTNQTGLSNGRMYLSAISIGDYALFAGGSAGYSTYYATVDTYNSSLTKSTATELSLARSQMDAATAGRYVLFGGGGTGIGSPSDVVDAYDSSLTRTTPSPLSVARNQLSATTTSGSAIFGGGYIYVDSSTITYCNTVDKYDANLTRTTVESLTLGRYRLAAANTGIYALFGGGRYTASDNTDTVDYYAFETVWHVPAQTIYF